MIHTRQRSFRINDAVVSAELDDQMVLLNVETGLYFGLDELGSLIWSMIVSQTSESEMIDQITANYDVDTFQVQSDVHDFIHALESQGLLRPDAR